MFRIPFLSHFYLLPCRWEELPGVPGDAVELCRIPLREGLFWDWMAALFYYAAPPVSSVSTYLCSLLLDSHISASLSLGDALNKCTLPYSTAILIEYIYRTFLLYIYIWNILSAGTNI